MISICVLVECDKCDARLVLENRNNNINTSDKNSKLFRWLVKDDYSCYCPKCYQEIDPEGYQRTMWLAGLD